MGLLIRSMGSDHTPAVLTPYVTRRFVFDYLKDGAGEAITRNPERFVVLASVSFNNGKVDNLQVNGCELFN